MCDKCTDLKISHAHVHTDASRIDGLGTPARLLKAAKERGMHHLAMTDHGTLANTLSFIASANAVGIKPIIGMEAYIAEEGETFHLTLLADGNEGMDTLIKLNNIGQQGEFAKPAISLHNFRKLNKGIYVLTGCPASPMQATDYSDARRIAKYLKDIFGERLFAEYMFVSSSHPWERAHKLATDLKLRPIVTNDVHFPYPEDGEIHTILVQLKAAFSYDSRNLYLATPHEIIQRVNTMAPSFVEVAQKGIRNSYRLLGRMVTPTWSSVPKLPHVNKANEEVLRICNIGLKELFAKHPEYNREEYQHRLDYEFNIIKEMDFATYFYILMDIVTYAKGIGVRVGPGRGSGAGSLMLFLLGITEINPIEYGLQFERFLNPKRAEMPDVDVDFDSDGRDSVLAYAKERWHGIPVATYARYTEKTLIADLARHFRIPRDISQEASDGGVESEAFERIAKSNPIMKPAFAAMEGQIRNIGQHAGGVIITDVNVPLERTVHGGAIAAWTEGLAGRELQQTGVVKYDLLGVSSLSVLRILEQKKETKAPPPEGDAPELDLFRKGKTAGIFQFSGSPGIVDFTKKVSPHHFNDLVAINALFRPGALDSGAAQHYPEWRLKPRKLHPLIDKHLDETYGVICYQEQFMAIIADITDGDLADADFARKIIVKANPGNPEWEAKIAKLKSDFHNGAERHSISKSTATTLWGEIMTHARYSFNKSHAVAYTMLSWEMAWWKYHYPADFFAALLTVDPAEAERYIYDVVDYGIEIVPPDVNLSSLGYESDGVKIYLPISAVKFLGEVGVKEIMEGRPYISVADFANRVQKRSVNSRARTGLWELGALKNLPGNIKDLGIKDPPRMSTAQKQAAYLGYSIPTPELMAAISKANKEGMIAGIIEEVIPRESSYGPYMVYRLLPTGTCWSRNIKTLNVGDAIKARLKKDSGKILEVYPLSK